MLLVLSKLERSWRGGIGRVTSGAARALAARGHELHMVGRAPDAGPPGELAGVAVHRWPARLGRAGRLMRLVALQRGLAAEVVHFHSSLPHGALIVPFLWARGWLGRPVVCATPHTGSRGDYPKWLARVALERVDGLIAPTRWSADRAIEAGAPSERCHVIWNGVDAVVEPGPGPRRWVVALGRIVPSKGMDVLLDAFEQAVRTRSGWRLRIAGEGRDLERLRRHAASLACRDRVELPGFVGGAAREVLFREAAIGVVPSRRDMIPGAMLELQAHGIATIASDVGAIAEGSDAGRAARLVPPSDVAALAEALGVLMDSRERRDLLSKEALRVSRQRLWSSHAEQLEAVYRSLLGEMPAPRGPSRDPRYHEGPIRRAP